MIRRVKPTTLAAAAAVTLVALAGPTAGQPAAGKKRQLLFFTKSSGYEHSVIKEADGQPSHATRVLQELGARHGFEVTASKDGGVFTREGLARFDVIVFFTSGDLTQAGTDKHPPLSAAGKELLLESVKAGKGWIGIHPASDTFHSPGDAFTADGERTDPFLQMLGGEFIQHGQQQTARLVCADPRFPGLGECTKPLEVHEEWYSFKNLAPDLHVLQWLATWSLKNTGGDSVYRRPPYPVTWARLHGKGRVFYTALGHREDVWLSPMFQSMLAGAVRWAAGDIPARVTPNVSTVTPGYAELPPRDPRPAPPPPSPAASPTPR
jgi:uncharacterized protein